MRVPAIRTFELGRWFGSVHALDDVSLEIPQGTIFGLLGPNGAGKTTMIRILLGLIDPSTGTAEVLGYDTHTSAAAIREHTGLRALPPSIKAAFIANPARLAMLPLVALLALVALDAGAVALLIGRFQRSRLVAG